jgi:hypothetical protein
VAQLTNAKGNASSVRTVGREWVSLFHTRTCRNNDGCSKSSLLYNNNLTVMQKVEILGGLGTIGYQIVSPHLFGRCGRIRSSGLRNLLIYDYPYSILNDNDIIIITISFSILWKLENGTLPFQPPKSHFS